MFISVLDIAASELAALSPRTVNEIGELSDSDLVTLNRLDARLLQRAQTRLALSAGEIGRRSAASLGSDGLAQRSGFRTPVELVRAMTGSTGRDASTAVRVGVLAVDGHPVSRALLDGSLSVAAADAIRTGLGSPNEFITSTMLTDVAASLCAEAATLDADRLFRRARELRDELDVSGIADREAARRAARALRFTKLPDGMARLSWLMDPETAAVVGAVYDRTTSPRRGGPRFVDAARATLAASILDDSRTTDQLASDVFAELLRHGADADSSQLLGTGAPVVTLITTRDAFDDGVGAAWIEGQTESVSIATVERLVCSAEVQDIVIDRQGAVLDLGREQRFYNRAQRRALATRDGGCRWPGCERPPSWTEAHHIKPWASRGGRTDLSNGILLCRHHHLLLHNNGWQILIENGEYRLIPPGSIGPAQVPLPMPANGAWSRRAG